MFNKKEIVIDSDGNEHEVIDYSNYYVGSKFRFWLFLFTEFMVFGIIFFISAIYFYQYSENLLSNVSVFTSAVDMAFLLSTIILIVIGTILLFAFKYHNTKVKDENIKKIEDNLSLRIAWIVIPTILLMVIFYYAYTSLKQFTTMPEDAFTIDVLGKKCSVSFTYPNGKITSELYVPKNRDIVLNITASKNDVLHSFNIPVFLTKEDVIPGKTTKLWFNASKIGRYDIECAEYSETRSSMLTKVDVMNKDKFDEWYASEKYSPYEKKEDKSEGAILFESFSCNTCHSMDGSIIDGPSLKDIDAVDSYLRESIMEPNKYIVEGYPPNIMPDMSDIINEKQLIELIKFINGTDKLILKDLQDIK